jgi:rsbT co-antagonist protein RsbR
VPIIDVWDGIVLLPLVGNIDTRRAQRVMERMLEAITKSQADYVLLDISGVPMVDTNVAASLMRAVQASRLLGCEPLIVGISPEIAQTLVHLGLDFSAVTAYSSLREGLLKLIKR